MHARARVIALDNPADVAYWLKALGVTHVQLIDAIAKVGSDSRAVGEYLESGSDAKLPIGEQKPDGG